MGVNRTPKAIILASSLDSTSLQLECVMHSSLRSVTHAHGGEKGDAKEKRMQQQRNLKKKLQNYPVFLSNVDSFSCCSCSFTKLLAKCSHRSMGDFITILSVEFGSLSSSKQVATCIKSYFSVAESVANGGRFRACFSSILLQDLCHYIKQLSVVKAPSILIRSTPILTCIRTLFEA